MWRPIQLYLYTTCFVSTVSSRVSQHFRSLSQLLYQAISQLPAVLVMLCMTSSTCFAMCMHLSHKFGVSYQCALFEPSFMDTGFPSTAILCSSSASRHCGPHQQHSPQEPFVRWSSALHPSKPLPCLFVGHWLAHNASAACQQLHCACMEPPSVVISAFMHCDRDGVQT